jgi:HSP20 family protein
LKRNENRKAPKAFRIKNLGAKRCFPTAAYDAPKTYKKRERKGLNPLVDVLEENSEIIVVSEFAGFNREDLKIHVENQRLTLSAETSNKKYHKSLNLPSRVIPKSIRTAHKNGVLEIRLKKVTKGKTVDKIVGLENAS